MPRFYEGQLDAKGLKFGIIVSRFNSFISERLLEGALDALVRHVPTTGKFKLPGYQAPLKSPWLRN